MDQMYYHTDASTLAPSGALRCAKPDEDPDCIITHDYNQRNGREVVRGIWRHPGVVGPEEAEKLRQFVLTHVSSLAAWQKTHLVYEVERGG